MIARTPSLVDRLWDAQHGRCFHCDVPMLRGVVHGHGLLWSREHVLPRKWGGKKAGNIVLAHSLCNNKRGSAMPTPDEIEKAQAIYAALHLTLTVIENVAAPRADTQPLGTIAEVWHARAAS